MAITHKNLVAYICKLRGITPEQVNLLSTYQIWSCLSDKEVTDFLDA